MQRGRPFQTNMKKYHYEYFAYTDNLFWGRIYLGKSRNQSEAHKIGREAGKGCYMVRRKRVHD